MEVAFFSWGIVIWELITIITILLPLIALFSLLRSNFKDSITKLIWLLVVIFAPLIGPILYFTIGRKQRVKIL